MSFFSKLFKLRVKQNTCNYCQGNHPSNECDLRWEPTVERYIWYDKIDKSYWFIDETERFDGNGPYKSVDEAKLALDEYMRNL